MSNQTSKSGVLALCIASYFFLSSPLQASFWVNDPDNQQLLLDTAYLSTVLQPSGSTLAAAKQANEHIIELILPNKDSISVKATPNTLIPSALAQRYPTLGSWDIVAVDDPSISGVMDMSEQGMHALLFMPNGELVVIDPDTTTLSAKNSVYSSHLQPYTSHYKQRNKHSPIQCETQGHDHSADTLLQSSLAYKAADSLITYRLALAATSQYVKYHGGTVAKALSAMVTTINRVNAIYKRDLGVQLSLIDNNDEIIFSQSSSDPYYRYRNSPISVLDQNTTTLNNIIGKNNYDIGHVFGQGSDTGLAMASSVCAEDKASGYTASIKPSGDLFDIDYAAHEIGHQLGADHTFNSETDSCSGGTRSEDSAFEPGSGSSIMGYAGICGSNNIQGYSDPTFHIGSITTIKSYTRNGQGSQCGTRSTTQNNIPTLTDAEKTYTIPLQTPFVLSIDAEDSDNNTLTYSWDQMDLGSASSATLDTGDNPILRVYPPSNSNTREFPSVDAQQSDEKIAGQLLPQKARELNFKGVVRDGLGGIATQEIVIQVVDSEPGKRFAITKHDELKKNAKITVDWNVAATDKSPINCSHVSLALSTDAGKSFPHSLTKNTENDGSVAATLPDIALDDDARLKLSCDEHIFFSVTKSAMASEEDGLTDSSNEDQDAQKSSSDGGSSSHSFMLLLLMLVGLLKHRFRVRNNF